MPRGELARKLIDRTGVPCGPIWVPFCLPGSDVRPRAYTRTMIPHASARLYFHAPCFDGAVSAAIASQFISRAWAVPDPELIPVNYDRLPRWITEQVGA